MEIRMSYHARMWERWFPLPNYICIVYIHRACSHIHCNVKCVYNNNVEWMREAKGDAWDDTSIFAAHLLAKSVVICRCIQIYEYIYMHTNDWSKRRRNDAVLPEDHRTPHCRLFVSEGKRAEKATCFTAVQCDMNITFLYSILHTNTYIYI